MEAMVMSTSTYPVHVDAHLDPRLNRGLWLVKWVLVIPHYVVLAFLWAAFVVMSVVAFFAILTTGHYPRAVFDFNVGVLRWTWRVAYYAYGALGTDRYPPFSLRERPDYPAHLEIDHPAHLSRGLVLVKWWLLAIPHYVTLAGNLAEGQQWVASTGLIGLLVLVAGVVLLFTGRYPQPLFDLVLGLNRWVLRVAAYAGLMTDQYPPFRLDQGGGENGPGVMAVPTPPLPSPEVTEREAAEGRPVGTSTPVEPTGWTAGRVTALVLASLLALFSLGLAAGGAAVTWADDALRDGDGYLMTGQERLTTETYALTSQPLEVHVDGPARILPDSVLGSAKLTATAPEGSELFLGVAAAEDVDRYLAGVSHSTLVDLDQGPSYLTTDGTAPRTSPEDAGIWRATNSGGGAVTVTWPVESGSWTVVAMNADGSAGVEADVAAGATLPALDWVGPVLLSVGLTGLVVAGVGLLLAIRSAERGRPSPAHRGSTR
jgi:hypothetical protein